MEEEDKEEQWSAPSKSPVLKKGKKSKVRNEFNEAKYFGKRDFLFASRRRQVLRKRAMRLMVRLTTVGKDGVRFRLIRLVWYKT